MITPSISSFYVTGVSYRKTDATLRSRFAISNNHLDSFFSLAPHDKVSEFFILSTCNRTEIFGFASHPDELSEMLCSATEGNIEEFNSISYVKAGEEALLHLFNVAAGLDSQILGDYEIVGQLRKAVQIAKQYRFIDITLSRMINEAIGATRSIRSNTGFSTGTVSVSFAAVQYLKNHFADSLNKKILLVGAGKISRNTCKNIQDYLPGTSITIVNRTFDKAFSIASAFGFRYIKMEQLAEAVNDADAILVATGSEEPIIIPEFFTRIANRLIIDFSIPYNVAPEVANIDGVTLIGIDELSRIKDATLMKRASEIPRVKAIVAEHMDEFIQWHDMRKHVPLLRAVKSKLGSIPADETEDLLKERIQKVINGVAIKMRTHYHPGCHYIEAINDFMSPVSDS